MADLPNRLDYEAEMAKIIAATLAQHRTEWQQPQTDSPQTERTLKDKLLALLLLLFKLGAGTAAVELGIAIQSEGAAKAWANSYAGDLARAIVGSISKRMERARMKDLTGEAGLMGDVVQSVTDPKTWGNLAATQVTTANTSGGEFTAAIYNIGRTAKLPGQEPPIIGQTQITPIGLPRIDGPPEMDLKLQEPALAYWHTSQDDRVCPICRPLHGRPRDEWEQSFPMGPPAHPACRCFLDYEVSK